ncbi:hypothetical protein XENOCAPTIV_028152 [Xenoophorus captivus]|uniref:Uncharacterized protein n=1 Tax=Xenoophorus captivus TaxID=1517983 RepID=A0ABV0QBT1_9TELE
MIHVGSNDRTRPESVITHKHFHHIFDFLRSSGTSVFVSGVKPTDGRGSDCTGRGFYSSAQMVSIQFNSVYLYSAIYIASSQSTSQSQVHTFQLIVTIEQFSQIQLFIQIG